MINELKCAECKAKYCDQGITDEAVLPSFCPMKKHKEIIQDVRKKYGTAEVKSFYASSVETEVEAFEKKAAREEHKRHPVRPRIREIAEFAGKIAVKKIGMAFCSGLSDEAFRACRIFESHGLDVYSIVCSCGALSHQELEVPPDLSKGPGIFQTACNPLVQAELLNRAEPGFNVIIGLCVGHDMLFTKNSIAPVTTLIVKDRLTGHNPFVSLYTHYHKDVV